MSAPCARVFIVDDHPMVCERLVHLIEKEPDLTVCGEAADIQQALARIQELKPDIAIIDITLKGSSGLELIKNLKAHDIALPVLVLSMHDESLYAERALRAGARGYITKDRATDEVMTAVRCVLGGRVYLSENYTAEVLDRLPGHGTRGAASTVNALADRELEVFRLIGQGKATREIALALNLGSKTVDTYRERIKQKLNLRNAAELSARAAQWLTEQT